ncbi:MAG: sterol desaturase family protein [Gemmatimonadetes bacterium]|nr:sterol desaturase family protein [Gemmatimonadota bacterium]NNL30934.1 sterol desaturase family protein [Gemmatimonadota bacterium]
MDGILLFFEQMPAWQKLAWVMACLAVSWALEGSFPLVQLGYRKWRHAGANFAFLATSLVINTSFSVAAVAIVAWTSTNEFGLLHLLDLPLWVELVLALVVLDLLAQYWAHYLLHKVRWMWRLHAVHHTDTKVDATTGTRLHPGDFAVREFFALGALLLTGAALAYYVIYRVTTIFFTLVTHANVAPPVWLDATLSWVFVTPNMHKFHHHFEQPWTDSNYGNMLSIWDRLFGTFVYADVNDIRYGLNVYSEGKEDDVLHQLALPFRHSGK